MIEFNSLNTKVRIKFSDNIVLDVTGDNSSDAHYIIDCTLNEEMAYKDGTPIGCVSTNSLNIKLSNTEGVLSPQNNSSPYFGLIEEGIEIELLIRVDGSTYIPFGTYYVKSWSNGTGDYGYAPVDIVCVDWIGVHSEDTIKYKHISNQATIVNFLSDVLQSQQLTCNGFIINYTSNNIVDFGCITVDKLGAFLNNISKGLCCYVYMNRLNQLCITDVNTTYDINTLEELSGNSVVYKGRSLDDNKTYGNVKVTYKGYTKSDKKELLKMENLKLTSGVNTFTDINIASGKIYVITSIVVSSKSTQLVISNYSYNQNRLSFSINSSVACECSVTVNGCELVEGLCDIVKDINNKKSDQFAIESDIIQNEGTAKSICDKIANIIELKNSIIELNTCVTPLKNIGDIVKVDVTSMNIRGVYKIIGMKMVLSASYRNTITLIKVGDY